MDRVGKVEVIKMLEGVIVDFGSVIVVCYIGFIVVEMIKFCGMLCEQGVIVKVVKNCFFKKVLDGKGGDVVSELFVDQIVIVYVEDFVVFVKVVFEFVKDNEKFVIVGGFMGDEVFDVGGVEVFFKMLFCEEFIVIVVVCFMGQVSQIVQCVIVLG